MQTFASQRPYHLARAVKRVFGEQSVDLLHQSQIGRTFAFRLVIKARPADRHKAALTAQTEIRGLALDHFLALAPAHRLSPFACDFQKIAFHRQLTDLGVKVMDLALTICLRLLSAI